MDSAWPIIKRALKGGGKALTYIPRQYAIYCMVLLVCISCLDQADRWALPTLQGSGLQCASCTSDSSAEEDSFEQRCEEECLDLTDSQMGFLTGPAVSLTIVFVGLPLGWLADRWTRVHILNIGLVIWSISTLGSAFCNEFWQLAFFRITLGVGQATVNPTAFSLLGDYFSPARRNIAMAAFASMIYLGQDLGLFTGIIAQYSSWRVAFIVLGAPGILLALPFYLTVWEPARGRSEIVVEEDPEEKEVIKHARQDEFNQTILWEDWDFSDYKLKDKLKYILSNPVLVCLSLTGLVRFMGGYAIGGWLQTFYRRVYGLSPTQISLWLAAVIPIGGLSACYIGGWFCDRAKRRSEWGVSAILTVTTFIATFTMAVVFLAEHYQTSFFALLASYFFAEIWYGPAVAIIQDVTPPSMRSLATAIYFIMPGFGGISPLVVGYMNEWFAIPAPYADSNDDDSYDPTYSLLIIVSASYLLSTVGFAITGILLRRRRIRFDKEFGRLSEQLDTVHDLAEEK